MGDFKGISERFSVNMVSEEGYGSERIRCEIGLEGLTICSPDGFRTLRKYPLNHISRWALRGSSLVLYTKTPVDVEEHTITLQGDQHTIQSVLDTLTCSCMQMVELLQSKEHSRANTEVTNSLTTLLNGTSKSKTQLPTVEEVEFWRDPEKAGWMQSQGEVIKSWRRRWFVLKQGFLFRFSSPDISSSTKPRGVVDLSKVTDVSEAREQTGRPNSLKLSTETGHVAYVCDSETELVEWFSALEGAVSQIVRKVAGVEDEPPPPQKSSGKGQNDWAKQLEKGFSSAGSGPPSRSTNRDGNRDGNPMVKIVGYDAPAQPSRRSSHSGSEPARQSYAPSRSDSHGGYGGTLNYNHISGIAGIANDPLPRASASSTFSDSFANSQQYPAYPVLTPSRSGEYGRDGGGYAASRAPFHEAGGNDYTFTQPGYQQVSAAPPPQQQQQPAPYGQQPLYAQGEYGNRQQEPSYPGTQQYSSTRSGYSSEQPPPQGGSWQVHYTAEGRAYYHNASTGSTQWEPPANMA